MIGGYNAHVLTCPRIFWLTLPPDHVFCRCTTMMVNRPLLRGGVVTKDDIIPWTVWTRPLIKMTARDHADATSWQDFELK